MWKFTLQFTLVVVAFQLLLVSDFFSEFLRWNGWPILLFAAFFVAILAGYFNYQKNSREFWKLFWLSLQLFSAIISNIVFWQFVFWQSSSSLGGVELAFLGVVLVLYGSFVNTLWLHRKLERRYL